MQATLRKLSLYWIYLSSVLLFIVILMTVFNITTFGLDKIARMYGDNVGSLPGYEDLVRLLMSCITLMLFPWAQLEKGHISVEFFTEHLSSKTLIKIDRIWLFITFILVVFLTIMMCRGLIESYEDDALSRILGWSEWPFYILGILSLVLWAVILFWQTFFDDKKNIKASNG